MTLTLWQENWEVGFFTVLSLLFVATERFSQKHYLLFSGLRCFVSRLGWNLEQHLIARHGDLKCSFVRGLEAVGEFERVHPHVQIGSWLCDLENGKRLYWSDQIYRLLGDILLYEMLCVPPKDKHQ